MPKKMCEGVERRQLQQTNADANQWFLYFEMIEMKTHFLGVIG
jgi:hypothetical protein